MYKRTMAELDKQYLSYIYPGLAVGMSSGHVLNKMPEDLAWIGHAFLAMFILCQTLAFIAKGIGCTEGVNLAIDIFTKLDNKEE